MLDNQTKSIQLNNIHNFTLEDTFECGQCFRWRKQSNGSYTGIVGEREINICESCTLESGTNKSEVSFATQTMGKTIDITGADDDFVHTKLTKYLDLNTDYASICKHLSAVDQNLAAAINFADGIRILQQPFEETVISFIISANNNVPRIMGIIDRLCTRYGQQCVNNPKAHAFPKMSRLATCTVSDFKDIGAGYRASYILKTAQILALANEKADNPFSHEQLSSLSLEDARKRLMQLPGVGPKVADCILLFSHVNMRAFPTDVWVKRVMEQLYFAERKSVDNQKSHAVTPKIVMQFADDYFGELAGYAQQYLFHYARKSQERAKQQ